MNRWRNGDRELAHTQRPHHLDGAKHRHSGLPERVKLAPGREAGAGPGWRVASRTALGALRSWQGPQAQGASVKTMLACPLPHWFQRHRVVGLAYRKAGWEGGDRPGSESDGQPRGWASWWDVRGSSRGDTWSHTPAASPAAPRVRCSERSRRPCSPSVLRPAEGRRRLRGRKANEKFKQAREQHAAVSALGRKQSSVCFSAPAVSASGKRAGTRLFSPSVSITHATRAAPLWPLRPHSSLP